jgi:hypothetical protein
VELQLPQQQELVVVVRVLLVELEAVATTEMVVLAEMVY